MQANDISHLSAIDTFWYWIQERQAIYLKKQDKLPWPWTDDKILQTYSFCNVFREQDTVTKQFREMFKNYSEHPDLWFFYCVARLINWPPTLQRFIDVCGFPEEWNSDDIYMTMRNMQLEKEKVYTGAYIVRGDVQRGGLDNNKPRYTVYSVLDPLYMMSNTLYAMEDKMFASIEACNEWLCNFEGFGGFIAYEVSTDLRHTRYLSNAPDIMTWANAGPGAKRGLNRIHGRGLEQNLTQKQAVIEMQELLSISQANLPDGFPLLEMRDIEHSLCEVDKYLRVRNGEGRPRSKYHVKS